MSDYSSYFMAIWDLRIGFELMVLKKFWARAVNKCDNSHKCLIGVKISSSCSGNKLSFVLVNHMWHHNTNSVKFIISKKYFNEERAYWKYLSFYKKMWIKIYLSLFNPKWAGLLRLDSRRVFGSLLLSVGRTKKCQTSM